jgi:glycosyltransferase involved in cell wall biosynthesis
MMNICICANLDLEDHTGGVDRILNMAKNVSTHEMNVYLVSRPRLKSLFSILLDNSKYNQIKSGTAKECPYPTRIRLLFPGIAKLSQEVLDKIVRILTYSFSSDVSLSYVIDPYLFVKLFFVCKKERISLIQFEFPIPSLSSFLVKKLLHIPLVYDAHNIETERMRSTANASNIYLAITKLIENASCKISDLIFVVSERDKEQLVYLGVPKRKIETIPNSVEIGRFSSGSNNNGIRSQYQLDDKIVLLFHGPLDYPPNREAAKILANRLMPDILEKHSNVHLLLVGRNPPKISNPNITITGFVENLADYIAAADIGLVPLLKGAGTRIKILEYMAAGKAVVSTVKGAEGLAVQDGIDILITKYPDSNFVNLVTRLIEDSILRKNIGANAQRKVVSLYPWKETAKKVVKNYEKVIRIYGKSPERIFSKESNET